MIAFICLFFPAVLSVGLFEHLRKEKLSRRHWLYRFCANTLLINGICFAFKRFILHTASQPFFSLTADASPAAALNYMVMALPAALVLVFLEVLCAKHAAVTLEEKTHE